MPSDADFIRETFRLAELGLGRVSPRPLVGSVVVKEGEIIGRGFYHEPELPHAEVWALREAGDAARGATIYINLEPCSHHGRTPPCTEAILAAGIARVVASIRDPNPKVDGRGFDRLRAAGIPVEFGVLENEGKRLNEVFLVNQAERRAFVHLKIAMSLDGRIATRTGESKWITDEAARAAGQRLRHRYDAILVGATTALADDPLLTDRTGLPRHRPLARVILDSRARLPLDSKLVQTVGDAPVIVVAVENEESAERRAALAARGVTVLPVAADAQGRPDIKATLAALYERGLMSVLIEGGAQTAGAFLDARAIDKATCFVAPRLIGGNAAPVAVGGTGISRLEDSLRLVDVSVEHVGPDIAVTGYPR